MDNKILVTRSSMPSLDEYVEEIRPIWESHWLTNMGVKHKELQAELEKYLEVPHVALYTNGHLALENAIAALNLPEGGDYNAVYLCVYYPCDRSKWAGAGILRC